MKYGSKTALDTLIRAENRSGTVETVDIELKTGELNRTAVVCAEPSRGTACAAACHVVEAERATSCGERRVEARVALRFRSTTAEGYWAGLVVGPRFTGLGRKRLSCKPVRWDCESGLRSVQLNRGFLAGLRFGPL